MSLFKSAQLQQLLTFLDADVPESESNPMQVAIDRCELVLSNNLVLPLLTCIQAVPRDSANGFQALPGKTESEKDAVAIADLSLRILAMICDLHDTRLGKERWVAETSGDRLGSVVYRHADTRETSEIPECVLGWGWHGQLMHDLPKLIMCTQNKGSEKLVWAARVVSCSLQENANPFKLSVLISGNEKNNKSSNNNSQSSTSQEHDIDVSVIDVIKASEEEGSVDVMRGVYGGVWKGLYDTPRSEFDLADRNQLQSWTDTTIAGISLVALSSANHSPTLEAGTATKIRLENELTDSEGTRTMEHQHTRVSVDTTTEKLPAAGENINYAKHQHKSLSAATTATTTLNSELPAIEDRNSGEHQYKKRLSLKKSFSDTNKESNQHKRILSIGGAGLFTVLPFLHRRLGDTVESVAVVESEAMRRVAIESFECTNTDICLVNDLGAYVSGLECNGSIAFDIVLVPKELATDQNIEIWRGLMLSTRSQIIVCGLHKESEAEEALEFAMKCAGNEQGKSIANPILLSEHKLRDGGEYEDEDDDDVTVERVLLVQLEEPKWNRSEDNEEQEKNISNEKQGHNDLLSVQSWERAVGLGLSSGSMDVAEAMHTSVIRVPGLLSVNEINSIHDVAKESTEFGVGHEVRSPAEHPDDWYVKHLQTNGFIYSKLPELMRKLEKTVRAVDRSQQWGLIVENEPLHARVVEYHTMKKRGALADEHHYDLDSLITIDVMLASPGQDFEGGALQTLDPTVTDNSAQRLTPATFLQGDASVFVSHKKHCVSDVTSGTRNVLVVEFWRGPQRTCPHRCERLDGICSLEESATTMDVGVVGSNGSIDGSLNRSIVGSQQKDKLTKLPFRLGSVSYDESGSRVELLWQPTESSDAGVGVTIPSVVADAAQNKQVADAFSLFD